METLQNVIELHDSTIAGIERQGNRITILFSHAYLFLDKKGWSQKAILIFEDAQALHEPLTYPATIFDGSLQVDSTIYENILQLPFKKKGQSIFNATFTSGESLRVIGADPYIELQAKPIYIEEIW